MRTKTLLIIGGSGFFGKSILEAFQDGRLGRWGVSHVIAMSRHVETLRQEAPHLISSNVELLSGDIANVEVLPRADVVIHAAASTDAARYAINGKNERQNIEAGVANYCRLAPRYQRDAKILYASSGAVYGAQPSNMAMLSEDFEPTSVNFLPQTKREYALAKRSSEEAIAQLGRQGLHVSIARCFAFVGKWLPLNQHFAIGNFILDGLRGNPVRVSADHRVYRSYMHADDLVAWLMTIADASHSECPIYNVGSEREVLLQDLASVVAGEFGVIADIKPVSSDAIDRYVPSTLKAKADLGLVLQYDLLTALRKTIGELRQPNPQIYRQ